MYIPDDKIQTLSLSITTNARWSNDVNSLCNCVKQTLAESMSEKILDIYKDNIKVDKGEDGIYTFTLDVPIIIQSKD